MDINPYLTFDGNCAEAFAFYAEVFGGEIAMMQKFGESPMADQFKGLEDRVMHATLRIGERAIMGSDGGGGPWSPPQGITIQTSFVNADEARTKFEALAEGGEVTMPFATTFWSKGFGILRDRFGMPWMVNCD